jgi:hypothetical protein
MLVRARIPGLAFFLSLIALAGVAGAGPEPVRDVVLLDQHGGEDSLGAHAGHRVIALVAEAGRLRQLKAWEVEIREALRKAEAGEVHILRIADVRPGRGTTRERILRELEGRVPPDVSILIDLEGRWRQGLGLDTSRPLVLLFDAEGRLAHRFEGRASPQSAALVAERFAGMKPGRRP